MSDDTPSHTLFIRNLPYSTTNSSLEEVFSDVGPVRSCFVVTEKDSEKCRGFGYVTFSLLEDAKKAKEEIKLVDKRKIFVHFAKRKPKKPRREREKKKNPLEDDSEDEETKDEEKYSAAGDVNTDAVKEEKNDAQSESSTKQDSHIKKTKDKPTTEDHEKKSAKVKKKPKPKKEVDTPTEESKTLQIASKSESESTQASSKPLKRAFPNWWLLVKGFPEKSPEHSGAVRAVLKCLRNQMSLEFPVGSEAVAAASLRFPSKADAKNAQIKLKQLFFRGDRLFASLHAADPSTSSKPAAVVPAVSSGIQRQARLIIRNLSFQCSDKNLKDVFKKFGAIVDVQIPEKQGKKQGFGFVQFTDVSQASNAMQKMNAKTIFGRPVAVDWALSKSKFEAAHQPSVDSSAGKEDSADSGSYSAEGEDSDADQHVGAKRKVRNNSESSEVDSSSGEESSSSEPEGELKMNVISNKRHVKPAESSDESDEESSDEDAIYEDENESDEEEEEDEDEEEMELGSEEDDDEDDDDEDSDFSDESERLPKRPPRPQGPSDTEQGKTVFIRNLPFELKEDDLEELFEEYGAISYCRIVMDANTERSRGTGFVQFKKKDDANNAVKLANGRSVKGRSLLVTEAVSRENAEKLREEKKEKEPKDNRNLYLVREGMIRPGTQAAEGLPKADLDKRSKLEASKRTKLKSPHIFVSSTRLSVHNIPATVTDAQLRKKFVEAVNDRSARITECRIMKDLDRLNSSGQGRSRGYAFINFSEHKHALLALRATNNSPALYGENKRLIVEFSLENRLALATKQKRMERSQQPRDVQRQKQTPAAKSNIKPSQQPLALIRPPVRGEGGEDAPRPSKKGPKGLPKHWGPKVRHQSRPAPAKPPKQPKGGSKPRQGGGDVIKPMKRPRSSEEGPPKKKKKGKEKRDDFDQMVNKYRKKLTSNTASTAKWFQ